MKMFKNVFLFLVLAVTYQFILCHMSAQIELVGSFTDGMLTFYEHMMAAPMEVVYFNQYVYLFGWLIFGLLFIGKLTQRVMPKGEMKGAEHGSNNFQTSAEVKLFLKNCTTPVLPLKNQEQNKDKDKAKALL